MLPQESKWKMFGKATKRHPIYSHLFLKPAGGRHEARELDIVALEMASGLNGNIKDIDCVRISGEKAMGEAKKRNQTLENELNCLKREVSAKFQQKVLLLSRRCSKGIARLVKVY